MNILVVEDDIGVRGFLRLFLTEQGHVVSEAGNGQEGLVKAGELRPDAIICDGLMPVMDGFQFLQALKRDRSLSSIPFIFHSAVYTGRRERHLAMLLGADAFLVKPQPPEAIVNALRAATTGRAGATRAGTDAVGNHPGFSMEYSRIVATAVEENMRQLEAVSIGLDRAKKDLQESEAVYRGLFENNPHPLWVYDSATLAFLAVNDAAVRKYGYTHQEFLSMTVKDIRPSEEVPPLRQIVLDQSEDFRAGAIWRHQKKDGTQMEVEVSSHALDFAGKKARIVLASDVSEQKRMERMLKTASEEWRATFDAMNDAIALLDRDGKILRCNKAMANLTGKKFQEMIGKSCWEVVHDTSGPVSDFPYEIMKQSQKRETLAIQSGNQWFEATADPIFDNDGKLIGAVHIMVDITERKRAEEALRVSEEKYRSVVESIGIGISVISPDMEIVSANNQMRKWFPDLDTSKKPICYRMYNSPPRETICSYCPTCKTFADGQTHEAITATPAGHEVRHYRVISSPIKDASGKVTAAIELVEDITDQKRAQDALEGYSQELTALNNASNTLMVITNLRDIYQEICNVIYSVFDLKMVWLGVIEEGTFEVKPVAHNGHEDGYLSRIRVTWDDSPFGRGPTGMAIKTKTLISTTIHDPVYAPWKSEAQKRGYVASLSVPLIYARNKCIGALNFYSVDPESFTPSRRKLCQIFANQAAIVIENARLIDGLENKVLERTVALEDTNMLLQAVNKELILRREEAEAASKSKTDFLANMSHELRTPLNAILGFSEIMLMDMTGPVTEKQREFLGDISKSGNHLLSLINDVLDLSKVEAGMVELETESVVIRDLFSGSLMMFKEKVLKHSITVESIVEPLVPDIVADQRMLKQVLVNLLSNAFKFTPDKGTVRIIARKVQGSKFKVQGSEEINSKLNEDLIEISVSDTGIGIPKEQQEKLFKAFQQIDSSLTRKHAGTGLGLSLCRRFVELHSGRIWVESESGKGSTFSFVIPIWQPKISAEMS